MSDAYKQGDPNEDPFARAEATAKFLEGEGRNGLSQQALATTRWFDTIRGAQALRSGEVDPPLTLPELIDALGSWEAVAADQGLDVDRCPCCQRLIEWHLGEEPTQLGFMRPLVTAWCSCGECDGSTIGEAREKLVRLALFNEVE